MSSDAIKQELLSYGYIFKDHTENQIKRVSKNKIDGNVIRIFKSTITDEKWLVVSWGGNDENLDVYIFAPNASDWTAYVQHPEDENSADEELPCVMFAPNWWNVKERYFYDQHLNFVLCDYLKFFDSNEYDEICENSFVSNVGDFETTIEDLKYRGFNVEIFDENTLPTG